MQKIVHLIARLIVARHECTHVRHCKENAPIYKYYVAPETPMMSSVIADCPDLAPPNILDKSTPMLIVDPRSRNFWCSSSTKIAHGVHWHYKMRQGDGTDRSKFKFKFKFIYLNRNNN